MKNGENKSSSLIHKRPNDKKGKWSLAIKVERGSAIFRQTVNPKRENKRAICRNKLLRSKFIWDFAKHFKVIILPIGIQKTKKNKSTGINATVNESTLKIQIRKSTLPNASRKNAKANGGFSIRLFLIMF
ncbi:hypothetical protein KJA13_02745 [Patescibacteria group bacterium]|nr:hypothetical protein [Patescibacteria group bacterium]